MAPVAQHAPLLSLPPECLVEVMRQLGASYFHEDIRRLTICKDWLPFARATLYSDLTISQNALALLLLSEHARLSLDLIEQHTTILDLSLTGFDKWSSVHVQGSAKQQSDVPDSLFWNSGSGLQRLAEWTIQTDGDLCKIAEVVSRSTKLRQILIRSTSEHCLTRPTLPRRDYLFLPTMGRLLSVQNLRSLDLDLCGSRLLEGGESHSETHICERIASLLLTLHRLCLRMRSICPDVLKVQTANHALSLSEVIVNLSLSNELPFKTSWAHPSRCGSADTIGFLALQADIEAQAQILVARMAAPKVVRILTDSFPTLELQSLDVLTGKRMTIAEGSSWDSDGQSVEDATDLEEESEIESLSP